MTDRTRCLRHHVWLAGCADCTAWHLTALHVRPARGVEPVRAHSASGSARPVAA